MKYDSVLGAYPQSIELDGDSIVVGERRIRVFGEKEAGMIPWRDFRVDVVLDCTGKFTDATKARAHIEGGGARKANISADAATEDLTNVLGADKDMYDPDSHHDTRHASCTPNW